MLFRFRRRSRSTFMVSMIASIAFVAAAIWAWGVETSEVLQPLILIVILGLGLVITAGLLVVLLKLAQRLFARNDE